MKLKGRKEEFQGDQKSWKYRQHFLSVSCPCLFLHMIVLSLWRSVSSVPKVNKRQTWDLHPSFNLHSIIVVILKFCTSCSTESISLLTSPQFYPLLLIDSLSAESPITVTFDVFEYNNCLSGSELWNWTCKMFYIWKSVILLGTAC